MILTALSIKAVTDIVLSKYATPVWGVVSGFLMYRLKAKSNKRDDFALIKESLYQEINRLKEDSANQQQQLHEAKAENEKYQSKYYELTTQHKELLKHCIFLTKEIKILKDRIDDKNESKTVTNVVIQTRIDPETTGT